MSVTMPAPQDVNLFGQLVTAGMVERATIAAVTEWIDTYLGQVERIETSPDGNLTYQPGAIERPRGIIGHREFEAWPEDQIPVVVVMCDGLAGQPERHGDSSYRAEWSVVIGAVVSDTDNTATRQLAQAYGAAIRAAMLQHKMLKSALYPNGFSTGMIWQDERYDDLPPVMERTLASARVTFSVAVDGVVTEFAGPRQPLTDATVDPGNWPTVQQDGATAIVTPVSTTTEEEQ